MSGCQAPGRDCQGRASGIGCGAIGPGAGDCAHQLSLHTEMIEAGTNNSLTAALLVGIGCGLFVGLVLLSLGANVLAAFAAYTVFGGAAFIGLLMFRRG